MKRNDAVGITATVIRSILDFLKLLYIRSELCEADKKENQRKKFKHLWQQLKNFKGGRELLEDPMVRMWMLFLIDGLVILPIPQVLVIFPISDTGFSRAMTFFVLQYLLRVIRTYFLFTDAIEVSGVIADATWAIFAFYVLLYLQSGHMFGALWYYFATEKATDCCREAGKNHTECSDSYFACCKSLLNDSCPISTGNTTRCSCGIYEDALQSGIVGETNFPKKLLRCLHWGLQKLSAFGQDLETGDDVGENIFAICITIYGVVLFVFLIGRMQTETARSQKINQKWQGIKQSKHYAEISGDRKVLRKFTKAKREKFVNKHVDVHIHSFLSDLSQDAANEVKRLIGRTHLEKVEELKNWDKFSLDRLCGYLKPVVYSEGTEIIREGEPINEMTFVLQGKIWAASDRMTITGHRQQDNFNVRRKELIDWVENGNAYQQLPTSDRTIRALTNVEAFTLKADDLKYALDLRLLFNKCAALIQLVWRFKKHKRANDKNAKPRSCLDCCLRTPDEGELH
ncbi:hypothetical protein AB3S75_045970 [Citrus x aurantiifolia]